VTLVPHDDDRVATLRIALCLKMNFGDQGTSRVDHPQLPRPRRLDDGGRDAMRTEHRHGTYGNGRDVLDENRAT